MSILHNYKDIMRIAVPSIISNISVPLLGMADIAITGHLGSEIYIGAISVGGTIFNMIYWIFNFLRFGTGALTSQSYGRRNFEDCALSLARSLLITLVVALLLISFQSYIKNISFDIMKASQDVKYWAGEYFDICIYGAIGFLGLFSMTGWYVGMQNTKIPLVVSLFQNVVNIIMSLIFVYIYDMGVKGVALGTLVAQISGFLLSLTLCMIYYRKVLRRLNPKKIFDIAMLTKYFRINTMIFLRTLCLVAVTVYFTTAGASMGDTILAANALLMQFFMMFTFFIDGFAYAGEALCGKHFGANDIAALHHTTQRLFKIGYLVAIIFVLLYFIIGHYAITLFTDQPIVVSTANVYFGWVLLIPIAGMAAFVWDGIYVGCGYVGNMLICTAIGAVMFFATWFVLKSYINNHALWLAFILYLATRGLVLQIASKKNFPTTQNNT